MPGKVLGLAPSNPASHAGLAPIDRLVRWRWSRCERRLYIGAKGKFDAQKGRTRRLHGRPPLPFRASTLPADPIPSRWRRADHAFVAVWRHDHDSNSIWQAIAGASYQYTPATSVKFGYRVLSYKRDDELLNKMTMGGFYVGLGFKF